VSEVDCARGRGRRSRSDRENPTFGAKEEVNKQTSGEVELGKEGQGTWGGGVEGKAKEAFRQGKENPLRPVQDKADIMGRRVNTNEYRKRGTDAGEDRWGTGLREEGQAPKSG